MLIVRISERMLKAECPLFSFTSIPFNAFEGCRKLTQAEYEGKTYRIERHKSEGLPWALDRIPHCFGLDPKKCKPYNPAPRFPDGYPYMDEYEYLNTGGEEED